MQFLRTLTNAASMVMMIVNVAAQYQVVHDAPNTTSAPVLYPLILADGSIVTHHWSNDMHVFRKYATDGELVWSKALGGGLAEMGPHGPVVLLRGEAGGFRFVRYIGGTTTLIEWPYHEEQFTYQIGNVDGNGTLTDAVLLSRTETTPANGDAIPEKLDAARTPDGGTVILITTSMGASGTIEMLRLDATGNLLWARRPGSILDVAFSGHPAGTVAVSPAGRIYYMEGGRYGSSHLYLGEVDNSSGDLLWLKHYVYGNTSTAAEFHDIALDGAGQVHATGELVTSVGRFHIFLRTTANGDLDRSDIYRTTLALKDGHFGIDALGHRFHRVRTIDPSTGDQSNGFLVADTLNGAGHFFRRVDEVVHPNNVILVHQRMDVAGDQLVFSGPLLHEHMDLAFTTRYETLSVLDPEAPEPCLMNDTLLSHVAVPLNIMTTTDMTQAVCSSLAQYYTSAPLGLSLITMPAEELVDLCPFAHELLGIIEDVPETTAGPDHPLVRSTLVARDTPIWITDPKMTSVVVHDARGAVVQSLRLGAARTIPTERLCPGIYFLLATDRAGALVRSARVIVE